MKELKVVAPEGYEIDKEKSTFEVIVFKKIKKRLPMKWEELGEIEGYYLANYSDIVYYVGDICSRNKNIFPSEKEAIAMLAMAQLCQLRNAWNEGWTPDWKNAYEHKYCIVVKENNLFRNLNLTFYSPMHFKSEELRDKFLTTFRDLLEEAKLFL